MTSLHQSEKFRDDYVGIINHDYVHTQDALLLFTLQLLVTVSINLIYIPPSHLPPLHKFTDSPVCALKNSIVLLLPAGVAFMGWWVHPAQGMCGL